MLIVLCGICIPAGAASTRGLPATTVPLYQMQPALTLATQVPACSSPCECMAEGTAQETWGAGGYTRCSETVCGRAPTVAAVIPYYCFRKNEVTLVKRRDIPLGMTTAPVVIQKSICDPGLTFCSGPGCVNLSSDAGNCGGCGKGCPVGKVCTGGQCTVPIEELVTVSTSDRDKDGKIDIMDDCPDIPNPGQEDYDKDGVGDECDSCVHMANPGQEDTDGDKVGDACDLCPKKADPLGKSWEDDMEAPGHLDDDGDLIGNRCDNCPTVANPGQEDANKNGWGDVCEADLSIQEITPVQSVYDTLLVQNKGTAFRVKVRSTASYPIKTRFRLVLPPAEWDMVRGNAMDPAIIPASYTFPEIWGPVEIPAHADNFVVMLPVINATEQDKEIDISTGQIAGRLIRPDQDNWLYGDVLPDVRAVPKPIGKTASFTVIVDPDNAVPETDETNNKVSSFPYQVITTRGYSFGIQRLNVVSKGWDPAWDNDPVANPQHCTKTCGPGGQGETRAVVKHNLEYLLAVFPLADDKVYARFLPGEETWDTEHDPWNDDRGAYLTHLYSKVAGTYDWGVGVSCGCCGGTMDWDTRAVLIGNSSGNIQNLAHEASHIDGVAGAPDCYGCGGNDVRCSDCVSSPGFWVNRWQAYPRESAPSGWPQGDAAKWTTGSADWLRKCYYMDFSDYAPYCWARSGPIGNESGAFYWDDGYTNTISNLADPADPKGILVKGAIHKNGTASFDSFTILDATRLDIEPGTQGDYHIVLLDRAGIVLSDTGFNASFFVTADPPRAGRVAVDRMAFASIIGWKDGTQRIELRTAAGQVLAIRQVSSHSPVVRILSPSAGERWKSGETRTVRWEASDADSDPLTAAVLVSSNGGSTWVPAGSELTGSSYTFDTTGLAGSDNARIKVRVSDGVNTAEAVSESGFVIIGESPVAASTTKAAGGPAGGIFTCMAVLTAVALVLRRTPG